MNRYQIAREVWTQYCHQNFGAVEYEFGHRVGFSEYLDRKLDQQQAEPDEVYLDNFMCAFCNHFQIDASDFNMTAFLTDWLDAEQQAEEEE